MLGKPQPCSFVMTFPPAPPCPKCCTKASDYVHWHWGIRQLEFLLHSHLADPLSGPHPLLQFGAACQTLVGLRDTAVNQVDILLE